MNLAVSSCSHLAPAWVLQPDQSDQAKQLTETRQDQRAKQEKYYDQTQRDEDELDNSAHGFPANAFNCQEGNVPAVERWYGQAIQQGQVDTQKSQKQEQPSHTV